MIKVAVWWDSKDGSGVSAYLINVPTEGARGYDYFKAAPALIAIRRALAEFEKDCPDGRVHRIDAEDTPDKVLQP